MVFGRGLHRPENLQFGTFELYFTLVHTITRIIIYFILYETGLLCTYSTRKPPIRRVGVYTRWRKWNELCCRCRRPPTGSDHVCRGEQQGPENVIKITISPSMYLLIYGNYDLK